MSTGAPVRALIVTPLATKSASFEAQLGLSLRAEAAVTGRCDCGARRTSLSEFEHESDCPAISRAVEIAIEQGHYRWIAFRALITAVA